MFKILDGREQFYQWDLNRQLLVQDASITEVHFCNRTEECSLVVEVKDGVANVPNILLQDNFRIKVYGYDGEATKHYACFGVIARSKPADYVYTETEIKRWEDYAEEIEADVKAEVEAYKAEVEAYVDAAKAELQGDLKEISDMLFPLNYSDTENPITPTPPPTPIIPEGESEEE